MEVAWKDNFFSPYLPAWKDLLPQTRLWTLKATAYAKVRCSR